MLFLHLSALQVSFVFLGLNGNEEKLLLLADYRNKLISYKLYLCALFYLKRSFRWVRRQFALGHFWRPPDGADGRAGKVFGSEQERSV